MALIPGSFSSTRLLGVMSYLSSTVFCLLAWRRGQRAATPAGAFQIMAIVHLMLLLDMFFEWRWALHEFWVRNATQLGLYGERREPQKLVLIALLMSMAGVGIWIWRVLRRRPWAALSAISTLTAVGAWCCEWISYHDLDRVFYFKVGGLMLVGLIWAALASVTCLGAWKDLREATGVPRYIR